MGGMGSMGIMGVMGRMGYLELFLKTLNFIKISL